MLETDKRLRILSLCIQAVGPMTSPVKDEQKQEPKGCSGYLWIWIGFYDKISWYVLMHTARCDPIALQCSSSLSSLSFQETSLQQSWVVALWSSETTYIYHHQSIIYLFSRKYQRENLEAFWRLLGLLEVTLRKTRLEHWSPSSQAWRDILGLVEVCWSG